MTQRPGLRHWCLLGCMALAVASCSSDDRTDEQSIFKLVENDVGECIAVSPTQETTIENLPVVPCTGLHSHEIYFVAVNKEETYPGLEALETFARRECFREFEVYVGVSPFDQTKLFYTWIVPSLGSWQQKEDREVLCLVGAFNGEPLTASVRAT